MLGDGQRLKGSIHHKMYIYLIFGWFKKQRKRGQGSEGEGGSIERHVESELLSSKSRAPEFDGLDQLKGGAGRYAGGSFSGLCFLIVSESVPITGSSHTGTASSNSFFLRLRLMRQLAITMKNMRPTRPTKPKTIPDRILLPRKALQRLDSSYWQMSVLLGMVSLCHSS
ncbi:hypothetical protein BYT27DRAFT_6547895 [Phlegmacium glaucopus]|nr:hypothetical protein BYT27DRAFT_6547895 [Phlegmacium glaucopus]